VVLIVLPIALLIVGAMRSLDRDINLGDEGYLVYGSLAVLRGEIPIRDFRAYDPLRYLWCALFFKLIGPGFKTARIAMTALSIMSIILIFVIILAASKDPLLACFISCLSVLWMHPSHKQGEMLFSVLGVVLALLLMNSNAFIYFSNPIIYVSALLLFSVFYGHNLLIYFLGIVALWALTMVISGLPILAKLTELAIYLTCLGFFLGVLLKLVPGYFSAFWSRKVKVVMARGTSNLSLPKPWVWAKHTPQLNSLTPMRCLVFKTLFSTMPVVYIGIISTWIFYAPFRMNPEQGGILASSISGLIFFHHFLSRADLGRINQIILPFIIVVGLFVSMVWTSSHAIIFALGGIAFTIWFLWPRADFANKWRAKRRTKSFETAYETLQLPTAVADRLNGLKDVIERNSKVNDKIFAVPINIAILAAMNRKTAVYDFFPVYPSTELAQDHMIEELRVSKPNVAILGKQKLDGREDLLFATNYAKVHAFIEKNYELHFSTSFDVVYLRKP